MLSSMGVPARRSQQYCGLAGTADLKTEVDQVHFEVKRYARIAACRFFDQAVRDAGKHLPVVAMREDRGEWLLMIRPTDILEIAERIAAIARMSTDTSD